MRPARSRVGRAVVLGAAQGRDVILLDVQRGDALGQEPGFPPAFFGQGCRERSRAPPWRMKRSCILGTSGMGQAVFSKADEAAFVGVVEAEDVGSGGAVAEHMEDDEAIPAAAEDHDLGQKKQRVLMQDSGLRRSGRCPAPKWAWPCPGRTCQRLSGAFAGAVRGQGLPDDAEGDGGEMIRGKEAPGQAVDALMDDQQDEDGQKQQEKLPVQKKAAACGDERGIGPCGQGQEGEHDQQGKGCWPAERR